MDEIVTKLNLKELIALKATVKERIRKIKKDKEQERILEEIKDEGYCLSKKKLELDGVCRFVFTLYVRVAAFDKEDKTDASVEGIHTKQDGWYEELDFEYGPIPFGDVDIDYDNSEWNFNDWDDPAETRGRVPVYFYFLKKHYPADMRTHVFVDRNGKIFTLKRKHEEIMFKEEDEDDDKYRILCHVDDWKDQDMAFII